MKFRVWTAITDGGDGEHHSHQFPTKEAMLEELEFEIEDENEHGGFGFDDCNYPVHFSCSVVDMSDYEVVE